jgi:uncharacterized protein DUF1735
MKLNNIKLLLGLVVVSSLTITSCLKDKDFNNGSIQSVQGGNIQVIGTGVSATNSNNFLAIAIANSSNDTVMNLIPVVLSTPNAASQDIHVTLVQRDSLLVVYNAANTDTTVTPTNPNPSEKVTHLVPPTKFTVVNPGGVVTIPKGSNTGYLQIKFVPGDFLGGPTYALGFLISAIAEKGYVISGNLNFGIVGINIKNKYDGVYNLRGFFNRTSPDYSAPYNETISLVTTGANSVEMYWKGGPAHPIAGGTSQFGSFTTEYFFDLTTNAIIAVDNGVTPGSPPFTNGPATDNRFDPATKTIYAQCYYNANLQRMFTDTMTYIGPRP